MRYPSVEKFPAVRPFAGVFLGLMMASAALAGGPPAVDRVSLKSGSTLRGAILFRQPDGSVLMAVSREWLQQADPKEFERQQQIESQERQAASTEAKERIEALLANPPENRRLLFFFKEELDRLAKAPQLDQLVDVPFFLVEIPGKQVGKLAPAKADFQKLALLAWKEGIAGAETRSAAELRRDLIAAGIDVDGPLPDLSELLPARRQSDAEWSARLAIVKYTLDDGLDFQGTGDALVLAGETQVVKLVLLLPALSSNVESLVGDLLAQSGIVSAKAQPKVSTGQKDPLAAAIAMAEQKGHTGFRITRLEINAERMMVAVQSEFIAKLDEGKWRPIWKHAEMADGRLPRPEIEATIANDPQVKQLLETLSVVGAGDAVRRAVRVGAATMEAQTTADRKFFEFRDRYVRRLDGPVLPLPNTTP